MTEELTWHPNSRWKSASHDCCSRRRAHGVRRVPRRQPKSVPGQTVQVGRRRGRVAREPKVPIPCARRGCKMIHVCMLWEVEVCMHGVGTSVLIE